MGRGLLHDWRLIAERPNIVGATFSQAVPIHRGFVRRWYCTRCRLIEETRDNAGDSSEAGEA